MKRILRYELNIVGDQYLTVPVVHRVLSIAPGRTGYHIDVWVMAEVTKDGAAHEVKRVFQIFGTGHPLTDRELEFIGTAVMPDGLVWHVFTESP